MASITGGITIEGDISITGVLTKPIVFNTPGTYNFVVPVNVSTITVTAVGGGGGGAGGTKFQNGVNFVFYMGGGGQGGNVVTDTVSVTSGQHYIIQVGAGGAGGDYGSVNLAGLTIYPDPGLSGGNTTITLNGSAVITAQGGVGGGSYATGDTYRERGGSWNGSSYAGPFAGGQNRWNGYAYEYVAPGVPSSSLSGGGAGGDSTPVYSNPGSGGKGGVGQTPAQSTNGSPGQAGYVSITW